MIDPHHIESLLKVNGLQKTAPDEQIRSVLLSARFKEDEIETALMILRENINTKQTKVDGLHKVFRTDQTLSSAEISKLLGINVDIDSINVVETTHRNDMKAWQMMLLWVASLILALAGIMMYMYSTHTGVFHPTMNMGLYASS